MEKVSRKSPESCPKIVKIAVGKSFRKIGDFSKFDGKFDVKNWSPTSQTCHHHKPSSTVVTHLDYQEFEFTKRTRIIAMNSETIRLFFVLVTNNTIFSPKFRVEGNSDLLQSVLCRLYAVRKETSPLIRILYRYVIRKLRYFFNRGLPS